MTRCDWCNSCELYINYHDNEWGVPVHEDKVLFEFILLESMQSGLSWLTILKKRENFKKAFDNFDFKEIAQYNEIKVEQLLNDPGIIRNKLKIKAAISNAKMFIKVQKEFGSFNNYLWSFVNNNIIMNHYKKISEVPIKSELSDKISLDLKKRGFKFLGSITIYSYLQAVGVINDHIDDCFKK